MGLTTALVLLEAGYEVELYTRQDATATTSAKAAAIWLPYLAKPVEAVNRWSHTSFRVFSQLAENPDSGISLVDLRVLVKSPDAWWLGSLPRGHIRRIDPDDLPEEFPLGYQLNVPLIETQLYLPFLVDKVETAGGKIHFQEIRQFEQLTDSYDYVVNCSGLGARELAGDKLLSPVKGQLLKMENQPGLSPLIADFAFDEAGHSLAYVIPRKDFLILGGTAIKDDFSEAVRPDLVDGIIGRCQKITGGALTSAVPIRLEVGLRPYREYIRLEAQGKIIHNYGHGGAGFTVSWGCAEAVRELVQKH